MNIFLARIREIIKTEAELLTAIFAASPPPPHDYKSLQDAVILEERRQEVQKLKELFSNETLTLDQIKEKFKAFAQMRAKANQGTSLSYFAMSTGHCNELYWKIAQTLFETKNLGETLKLLLPKHELLEIDLLPQARMSPASWELTLAPHTTLSSLNEEASEPKVLTRFVEGNDLLFNLEFVTTLGFEQYQTLQCELKVYPALQDQVFQHNAGFKKLFFNLNLVVQQGKTPRDAIRDLIRELARAGTKYTASGFAASSAGLAAVQCREYLDSLPQALRESVLDLQSSGGGKSIGQVFNALAQAECVETASKDLERILQNAASLAILTQHPSLTGKQVDEIRKQYGLKNPLSATGASPTTVLPLALAQVLLSKIQLNSAYDYIDFLLQFPPEEYDLFLKNVSIACIPVLPLGLAAGLNIFNASQIEAFFNAIIRNENKFGGKTKVIQFLFDCLIFSENREKVISRLNFIKEKFSGQALLDGIKKKDLIGSTVLHHAAMFAWRSPSPEALKQILELLPEKDRLTSVLEKNNDGGTVLHCVTSEPASLKQILELLPEKDRLTSVIEKNKDGSTVLHDAVSRPRSLKQILALLPEKDRLMSVIEKNKDGSTVLHCATSEPESLKQILELLPEKDRLMSVIEKNKDGSTVLHCATSEPESLKQILELLPEKDRLTSVMEKNEDWSTVLHCVAYHSESLKQLLELLPAKDRLTAVMEKNKYGDTVLHRAAFSSGSVKQILELLPEKDRLTAVMEKETHDERTVLHLTARHRNDAFNPESLKQILELLPEEDRLTAVMEKNEHGDTILHCVAYLVCPKLLKQISLKQILKSLPEEDRLKVVMEKNNDGETVLHFAASDPELLKQILESLPEKDRLIAVMEKNKYGDTVLHRLIDRIPESLKQILESLPEKDRLIAVGKTVLHRLVAFKSDSLKQILG